MVEHTPRVQACPEPARFARELHADWLMVEPPAKKTSALARLLPDALMGIGIAVGTSAFLAGLPLMGGAAVAFALPYLLSPLPTIFYAPFACVVLFGIATMRLGFVLGPALVAGTVYWLIAYNHDKYRPHLDAVTPPAVAPMRNDHTLIALDNSRGETARIHVLARTPLSVATGDASHRWRVERPASGEVCFKSENVERAMQFLDAGYVDKCSVTEIFRAFTDGLYLRTRSVTAANPAQELTGFYGHVFSLSERIDDQDRLLARRLMGEFTIAPPIFLKLFGKQPEKIDLGPRIDADQFLADAAGMSLEASRRRLEPFPFAEVLDRIELYFQRHEEIDASRKQTAADAARYRWWTIASRAARDGKLDLRPRVTRLLAATDTPRLIAALNTVNAVPPEQRDFADARMFELVFLVQDKRVLDQLQSAWRLRRRADASAAPIASDLRAQAAARMEDASLNAQQREILRAISGQ